MPAPPMPEPRRLLDHPIVTRQVFHPRPSLSAPDMVVETDGCRLGCHLRRFSADSGWVVYFHGNGELAADGVDSLGALFAAAGVNVCHAEYRGYGQSTGVPALASMLDDGERIVAALGVPPHRVVAFGRSLGSLYAIELARRLPTLGGLVLDSGIAALSELWPLRNRAAAMDCAPDEVDRAIDALLDHRTKLADYRGPLLVLHAAGDRIVLPSHGERLRDWAGGSDTSLVTFPRGDHNSIFMANHDRYVAIVADFLRRSGITAPDRHTAFDEPGAERRPASDRSAPPSITATTPPGGRHPRWLDTFRGLRGSLALAALLVVHDGLLDGGWLLAGLVCPLWLLAALLRLKRNPAMPWGMARVLFPIVTGLVIAGNATLQRRIATTNAARLVDACERHREAVGEYPARLADLVPRFMPAIPRAKYCLMRGEYRYTGPPTTTLSWFDTPPFRRRVYRFDTGTWRSVE